MRLFPSSFIFYPLPQTELTLRLGLQLPFEVNYDGLQQLFYTNRVFEEPGRSQITVGTTKSPLTTGAGPFFRSFFFIFSICFLSQLPHRHPILTSLKRIERNDFTSGVFHASFCIFRSGKIQARCSKIPADVSAMIAACESVLSILFAHRSQIEAPESGATAKQPRGKGSPPSVPPAAHVQASSAFSYPKGLLQKTSPHRDMPAAALLHLLTHSDKQRFKLLLSRFRVK